VENSTVICNFYGSIYGLRSPSNKWYIGQTTDVNPIDYININYKYSIGKRRPKIANALKFYGFELFEVKIFVYLSDKASLDIAEVGFIEMYNSIDNGYNCRSGGHSGRHSEESKLKISKTLKGHIVSIDTREKISKAQIGRVSSDETNRKRSISMTGKKIHTEEHKLKVGLSKIKYEYELLSPNGELFKTNSLNAFEKHHDLHRVSIIRNGFSKGWKLIRQHLLDDNQTPVMMTLP
jgi:group I intron endonuclease